MDEGVAKTRPDKERAHAQNLKRGIARDDELYATKHAEHLARQAAAAAVTAGAEGTAPARAERN